MNEKILLWIYQIQYIIIHIPKRIYHVVIFCLTQARGVKESSHFPKIRLFGVGCESKLKRWLGKQNAIQNKKLLLVWTLIFLIFLINEMEHYKK
jgi:hypothetical protein